MRRVKIAIQKSGKLYNDSVNFLQGLDLSLPPLNGELFYSNPNIPLDILSVRDDDIPALIAKGACDYGIVGLNVLKEFSLKTPTAMITALKSLNFGSCRLSLAVPNNTSFYSLADLNEKRIATSYPYLLTTFLKQNQIKADITTLSGAVEIAPRLGIADLICDLVSTGKTLFANDLKEVEVIMRSQAVLISTTARVSCWFEDLVFSKTINEKVKASC